MTVDADRLCDAERHGMLASHAQWLYAFAEAGRALADLADGGRLERGLRAVLAHHIIFHANRAGLSTTEQSVLAALAVERVFGDEASSASVTIPETPKVDDMTTLSNDRPAASAAQLRFDLAARLGEQGIIHSTSVADAFHAIPRERFVPDVALKKAYADEPLYTKTDGAGVSISAASQPRIVAMMLEQLAARPGEHIMEAGAGTGVNAAYMGHIVGPDGRIVTIDVDADLVDGARAHLAAAGVCNVEVILGDGALGHLDAAPYNKVIATVGAYEVPTAWLEQVTPDGRIVVPLRLRGAASRSIAFERRDGCWRSVGSELAVFMPLRGIGDDARRTVALTLDNEISVQVHQDQAADAAKLAGVLETTRRETWTGVVFPPMVSSEWLDLWLACRLHNAIMRMSATRSAIDAGLVTPMFGWGAMATVRDGDLAYLTVRPARAADDGKLYEVGVVAHGPTGADLADQVAEEIRLWDKSFRDRTVRFELPDTPATSDPADDRFVLDRPNHSITVIWE